MKRTCLLISFAVMAAVLHGCANVESSAPPVQSAGNSDDSAAPMSSETFSVEFVTTKGNFTVVVHPDWAPLGAQHFRDLVEDGFYDNCAFFRVVDGFMAQFGISGEPAKNKKWEDSIMDDPVRKSNLRGYMTYAKTGAPNSRSTQLFISFKDNRFLDSQGFAPFGQIDDAGMKVVDSLNKEYGEPPGSFQGRLTMQGQSVLDEVMPNVDYIKTARIVGEENQTDIPAEGF